MTDNMLKIDENSAIPYDEAISRVREEVGHSLSGSPRIIREYTRHLLASQGKFIRAASVIIAALDKEGNVHVNAVKIAAAIEILHLASLVHDDVMDNADIRRGNITLQKKYGKRTAVICGDYLLSVALNLAASVKNKKDYAELDLPDYIGRLCLGELNQHINNGNLNLSIYQYFKIISGKTAALFEASYFAGAVLAGSEEEEAVRYRQLGYYTGMIFQLTDDCNDFEVPKDEAAKPVQSDYEQGVVTLPLIHAFEMMPEFRKKASAGTVTRQEINTAVEKAGGLSFTRLIIKTYYNKAIRVIKELDLQNDKRDKLISLLDKASRMI